MDIQRHLSDEPVLARPPSAKYKAGKFIRKHRMGVAAATMVAIALVAGIVGTTVGLVKAVKAERVARSNEARASSVSNFLTDMLSKGDINDKGLNSKLSDVLDAASRSLDSSSAPSRPEVDAAVRRWRSGTRTCPRGRGNWRARSLPPPSNCGSRPAARAARPTPTSPRA